VATSKADATGAEGSSGNPPPAAIGPGFGGIGGTAIKSKKTAVEKKKSQYGVSSVKHKSTEDGAKRAKKEAEGSKKAEKKTGG